MFLLQVIGCVIFVYGLLSLAQDIWNEIVHKKVFHDMKIVVFGKNLEKNIESFIIEFYNMKKINPYKQIVVVDLEENDDIKKIENRLINNEVNVEVLSKEEGKEYINELF